MSNTLSILKWMWKLCWKSILISHHHPFWSNYPSENDKMPSKYPWSSFKPERKTNTAAQPNDNTTDRDRKVRYRNNDLGSVVILIKFQKERKNAAVSFTHLSVDMTQRCHWYYGGKKIFDPINLTWMNSRISTIEFYIENNHFNSFIIWLKFPWWNFFSVLLSLILVEHASLQFGLGETVIFVQS